MIDGYKILKNGDVKVTNYDENGIINTLYYKYQDNIEEILKLQNIEEYLLLKKDDILNEMNDKKELIEECKKVDKVDLFFVLACMIFSLILKNNYIEFSENLFFASAIIGVTSCVCNYHFYNKEINYLKEMIYGLELEIEEIEKRLDKTDKEIKKLKENKQKNNLKTLKSIKEYIKLDDKKNIEEIWECLHTLFVIGCFEEELYERYLEMIKYHEPFTDGEILIDYDILVNEGVIKKYFDEKGPVLAKKYNYIKKQ